MGRNPPPPGTHGKTERGQRTRLRILRAAEKVFGDEGFYDARISEITRTAGVAAGTFYLYFRSKEELLRALLQQINHDLRKTLSEGTDHLPSRAEAEVRGFEIFFYDFLPRHQKLYRIIKQAEFADPPLYEWYYHRIADGYADRLRAAMDRGEFRNWDEDLAACTLMGIAEFVAMRYLSFGHGLPRKKMRELMEFILGGLRAPPPPTRSTPARSPLRLSRPSSPPRLASAAAGPGTARRH